MAKYLDLEGLQLYDSKMKMHISEEDDKIKTKYGEALSYEDLDEICV